jgi:hypothetical protein
MPLSALSVVTFSFFATGLVWAAMGVMVFWMWQTAKTAMNWLLLVGVALTALFAILAGVGIWFEGMGWVSVLGAVLVTLGYYVSVKPVVDDRLRRMQAKHQETVDAAPTGAPPPSIGAVRVRT